VDVYIPGCPPRPEAVIDAVMKIQNLVETDAWKKYKQENIERLRKEKIYAGPNLPWEVK
jgi:NADH-quinone oxidoreductase subunit B